MDTQTLVAASTQEFMELLTSLPEGVSEEANVDLLQQLERVKRAIAGVQARVTYRLSQQREAEEARLNVPTMHRGKGLEAEVGLARGESAFVGSALTYTAKALSTVLPNTLAALSQGLVSEYHARIVCGETLHLSDEHRIAIDEAIAHRLGTASTWQLRKLIEGHALRLDREAAEQRAAQKKARRRRVTMDCGSDGFVYLTAQLPTQQGLAVMKALEQLTNRRIAAAAGTLSTAPAAEDSASGATGDRLPAKDETMADIFVELLTGQTTANGVTAEVVVVMQDTTVFGDDTLPAWVPGHGPLPANLVKDWLEDPEAAKFIRRMYTRPQDGQLTALESRRRRFPDGLARMFRIRDDTCATPWCNNTIQDCDHRTPWAKGGPTSWANGNGLCKRCNQRKENRGWTYTGTPDRLTVITPTGHRYTVPTLPPISEIARWNSDPPIQHLTTDIAWSDPAMHISWAKAA